jgi:hypothetical protein
MVVNMDWGCSTDDDKSSSDEGAITSYLVLASRLYFKHNNYSAL